MAGYSVVCGACGNRTEIHRLKVLEDQLRAARDKIAELGNHVSGAEYASIGVREALAAIDAEIPPRVVGGEPAI